MAYHFRKTIFHTPFTQFVEDLIRELDTAGFVILATSDIRKAIMDSLQIDMDRYEIVSVIIPHLFNELLVLQPFTGFVLPAFITISETEANQVEVSVACPSSMMAKSVRDPSLQNVADEVERRLNLVIALMAHKPAGIPDGLI